MVTNATCSTPSRPSHSLCHSQPFMSCHDWGVCECILSMAEVLGEAAKYATSSKTPEPSYNVKMLALSCKNIKCNSWQSHHCKDVICRNSLWLTPMPQYTYSLVECIPWQYVQAVFQRTQKAVTWDCFQRRFSGPLAWGGRCPSLAPQPKTSSVTYIHVMSLK